MATVEPALAIGLILRIAVYVTVIAGGSVALYGIATQQNDAPNNVCLLFPYFDNLEAGNKGWCRYVESSAAIQLAVAVLMVPFAIVKVVYIVWSETGRRRWIFSLVELFLVFPIIAIALSGAIILHLGLDKFCANTKHTYEEVGFSKSSWMGCSSFYSKLYQTDSAVHSDYYRDLSMCEVGLWVSWAAWLFNVMLAIAELCRSSKRGSGGLSIAAPAPDFIVTTRSEQYTRLEEPI